MHRNLGEVTESTRPFPDNRDKRAGTRAEHSHHLYHRQGSWPGRRVLAWLAQQQPLPATRVARADHAQSPGFPAEAEGRPSSAAPEAVQQACLSCCDLAGSLLEPASKSPAAC